MRKGELGTVPLRRLQPLDTLTEASVLPSGSLHWSGKGRDPSGSVYQHEALSNSIVALQLCLSQTGLHTEVSRVTGGLRKC